MIEISVVSGTYNRLSHLQQMVESVRQSLGGRIPYEVVLVDGGSKDGTQSWCKSQSDIRLIEQGKLLGAVKAFNAGAFAATGKYIILANDDILFNDRSILRALSFMEESPAVGVGCLHQDRGGREWHVEVMPAVSSDGRQTTVHYGQVCIVPKVLGDRVGWWGNVTHTYGGDNELSANILELGYLVVPIECACISDLRVEDALRKTNAGDPAALARQGKPHPDTQAWYRKWTRGGLVGPRLVTTPQISIPRQERHRVLYAPIYEPGNRIQRQTKVGLLKALQKKALVYEYDYTAGTVDEFFDVADDFQPTLFLLQIQGADFFTSRVIQELQEEHSKAIFVSWNGDYHLDHLYDPVYMDVMKHMDVATFVTADIEQRYRSAGIFYRYWQIGYEESSAVPDSKTPKHDVVFMANGYSKERQRLGRFLYELKQEKIDVGMYGHWPFGMSSGNTLYDFDAGQRLYKNACLAISDQQWPTARGYVSNRLFQTMAAGGCMVLQQRFDGIEEYIGLKDGHHLVLWDNFQDLKEYIRYYLEHDSVRMRIAKTGHEFVLKNHSFDRRVEELLRMI